MKRSNPSHRRDFERSLSIRLPKDYHWQLFGHLTVDLRHFLSLQDFGKLRGIFISRDADRLTRLFEEWGLQTFSITSPGTTLDEIRAKYQMSSLLKKYQGLDLPGIDQEEAAFSTFIKAEIYCRNFNVSGRSFLESPPSLEYREILLYAKEWIQKVLGEELPEEDLLTLGSRHGPGASTNTSNGNTCSYFKYGEWPYDVTARAFGVAVSAIKRDERWWGVLEEDYRKRNNISPTLILNQERFWHDVLNIVPGNKISFVPKSYKTHRTIAVEPTMNLYLQLGVDGFIRKRLKRWGIDLNDQSKNQQLARLGSQVDGPNGLSTLDLSMASDTISVALVRELLPQEWFSYLMDLRSPKGVCKGRTFVYEKISSMGNGFTFALESLIFASLLYGIGRFKRGQRDFKGVAVYGDDIIVRTEDFDQLTELLKNVGFHINSEKSFSKGPIRESCGADWLGGKPVRPVFLTHQPTTVKELFSDFNRLKRILELRFGLFEDECSTLQLIKKWIPIKAFAFVGPYSDEEFDTYIHVPRPPGRYINCVFKFSRLLGRPKRLRKTSFGFRKLMNALVERPAERQFTKLPFTQGNSFEVPLHNAWYLATSRSASSVWRSEYAEPHGSGAQQ